ncbi:hypothetical protein Trydic_g13475, partial [Trypoxylus dichotomus]
IFDNKAEILEAYFDLEISAVTEAVNEPDWTHAPRVEI